MSGHMNESWHYAFERVFALARVLACEMNRRIKPHICMSQATRMNGSWHTRE